MTDDQKRQRSAMREQAYGNLFESRRLLVSGIDEVCKMGKVGGYSEKEQDILDRLTDALVHLNLAVCELADIIGEDSG